MPAMKEKGSLGKAAVIGIVSAAILLVLCLFFLLIYA